MLDLITANFDWLLTFIKSLGYIGAFLAGLLGSSSLFISIFPSFIVVPILAATSLSPIMVGILAGIGAGLGQYLHYYIGSGGRHLLSEKKKKSMDIWNKRLNKYGILLVFLFAVTPATPDDLLWIPLGFIGYPKLKALVVAIFGKIILNVAYALIGANSIPMIFEILAQYGVVL